MPMKTKSSPRLTSPDESGAQTRTPPSLKANLTSACGGHAGHAGHAPSQGVA